jgi:hypothetical protein
MCGSTRCQWNIDSKCRKMEGRMFPSRVFLPPPVLLVDKNQQQEVVQPRGINTSKLDCKRVLARDHAVSHPSRYWTSFHNGYVMVCGLWSRQERLWKSDQFPMIDEELQPATATAACHCNRVTDNSNSNS